MGVAMAQFGSWMAVMLSVSAALKLRAGRGDDR